MTGIIICDNCGRAFLGNGSLKKIHYKTSVVFVLIASKLKNWRGTRKITSKKIGNITVPIFEKDICEKCERGKK